MSATELIEILCIVIRTQGETIRKQADLLQLHGIMEQETFGPDEVEAILREVRGGECYGA